MILSKIIEIDNLTKRYGSYKAVNDISFSVENGEILGFLGPNGAGKSTTMNILTGYISSTSGKVLICGHDIMEEPNKAKSKIGYLPEQPPLYFDMTVAEYLDFVYDLKKIKTKETKNQHISRVMATVGIDQVAGRLIKNLSKGYKQRVGLAQALIGDPEVLVLDEPTVGLDPRQIIEIRNVIKKLGKQRTIILSTHILQEVSAICDRVVIINSGKIVAMDSIENLSGNGICGKFRLRAVCDEFAVKNILSDVKNIKCVSVLGSKEAETVDVIVEAANSADIRQDLFNAFAGKNVPLVMIKPMEMTLEEIFINATSANADEQENISDKLAEPIKEKDETEAEKE